MKILIAWDEDNVLDDYFCFMCEKACWPDKITEEMVHYTDGSPVCDVPTEEATE